MSDRKRIDWPAVLDAAQAWVEQRARECQGRCLHVGLMLHAHNGSANWSVSLSGHGVYASGNGTNPDAALERAKAAFAAECEKNAHLKRIGGPSGR